MYTSGVFQVNLCSFFSVFPFHGIAFYLVLGNSSCRKGVEVCESVKRKEGVSRGRYQQMIHFRKNYKQDGARE